jgi:hypothetical protein
VSTRLLVLAGVLVWAGSTLLLSQWGRVVRPSLEERLRPYSPGGRAPKPGGVFSVDSVRDLVTPMLYAGGDRVAAAFGASEPASLRLRRIHSPVDASAFRLRQFVISGAALLIGATLAAVTGLPIGVSLFVSVGAPLLAFLVIEQRLSLLSQRWQRAVAYEMPVVSEQVAMLLNSGYSVGAALARVAWRGNGCVASDLATVVNRTRQGLSESEALREWAELARVEAVDRMVSVLTLHSEAADLGRLVSGEARQARRDLHRRTVETIERRAQQVWVPVTVATLVPGAILLAVPFLSALRLFSNA